MYTPSIEKALDKEYPRAIQGFRQGCNNFVSYKTVVEKWAKEIDKMNLTEIKTLKKRISPKPKNNLIKVSHTFKQIQAETRNEKESKNYRRKNKL
jgi:hypothetical protein